MIESGTLLQGRFLIEERIGEGGMGAVYRAVDQKFGTSVAVKETFYGDDELAAAFEREARLLNGLHHPIFPHVSDYFSDSSGHYLVMEYIEGEDLSAILKRGEVFSVEEVMRWTLDLLDGLDYLHSQDPPVIHRDIKPNNLKLTSRGNIVLLDFGMAKETSGNTLGMRSVFGYSRRYSPLEQIEGTGTDPRSDIFSLGATVYHLLTGKPPVDVLARASAIVSGKPDPLQLASEFRPDLPESVAAIIHSALSLNQDQRFISARAMWNALEYALGLDFVEQAPDQAAPEDGNAAAVPLVISHQDDFPALEAYRAESDQEGSPDKDSGDAVVPVVVADQVNVSSPEAGSEVGQETAFSDALPVQENDGYDEPPLHRAVIHLGSVDDAGGSRSADDSGEDAEQQNADRTERIPVRAAAEPWSGARVFESLARPAVWIPLLLLCAILALFGLAGRDDGSQVQGTNTALPAESPSAAAVEPATVGPETSAPAVGGGDISETEIAASDEGTTGDETISAGIADPADTIIEEEVPDTASAAPRATRSTTSRNDRPQNEREVAAGPERGAAEPPAERRGPVSRAERPSPPPQARRQRTGVERPRIVPVWNEPSAVTIETVLTGVPYGRRGRGDTDWMDKQEEKEFRRRLKRMRRQFREDRYPPF